MAMLLLNNDSTKSPKVPEIKIIMAIPYHFHGSKVAKYCVNTNAMSTEIIAPPKKPSHVFLGETRSKSFLFPKTYLQNRLQYHFPKE